ncbi:DUF951 domain-containing protein [Anoxybacter fermentans]|uniref:DUF951 domain-containing protein n=1 Tax=Anoxybacter fermentans TaxID=1323375 RepID=A0A3Q9HRR7_9FIRM|nr:DUF951 domain-containing protein [Anoxybacter fermentans]
MNILLKINFYGRCRRLELHLGDIAQLKKKHPCGSDQWEIIRVGMDIRIRCLGCDRVVLIPRRKFEKSVKKIIGRIEEDS